MMGGMRPFYAFVTSHCLATDVLLAAIYFIEERGRGPASAKNSRAGVIYQTVRGHGG